jgi:carbamoyltransferase
MADPRLVLGIAWGTHDSSAALFAGGRLVGFVEEERLSGRKHAGGFPAHAVEWLLAEASAEATDVGVVAHAFSARGFAHGTARATAQALRHPSQRRSWARAASYLAVHARTRERLARLRATFPAARVADLPHHLCHSRYAHAACGAETAAVLTVDSVGEWHSTSIVVHGPREERVVLRVADPHSLGYAYGAVTEHLGHRRGDEEGTVMALAALGDPQRHRAVLRSAIRLARDGFALDPTLLAPRVFSSRWPRLTPRFAAETCRRRAPDEPLEQVHADLAAALQERTDDVLLHLGSLAATRTRASTLCLAGGVAMNCVGAGRLSASGLFERVFVPSAPGDAGTSIGAALAFVEVGDATRAQLRRWDLGPAFDAERIAAAVRASGLRARPLADPVGTLADELAAGRIVGLFRQRLEAGPRALGHRSILASPLVPGMPERLSERVKLREPFRPFAPVVTAAAADEWFDVTDASPYMSFALPAREQARRRIPAIVHRNGTARVETLQPQDEPFLHALLERFCERTGVPVLINTSLNVKGEPMAGSPESALACMQACELDALLLEHLYVTR